MTERLDGSEPTTDRRRPGDTASGSWGGRNLPPHADLRIADRYRVTEIHPPEGTITTFAAVDERLSESVTLTTGIIDQRLELDSLVVTPFLQCLTWLAASPCIVPFREVLTTPVRRYLVSDAPIGQQLAAMPDGFSMPVLLTTMRTLAEAIHLLDDLGETRYSIDPHHVWIEPNGAAQLGGIEHTLGGAQLIGGWAGLGHAPPEVSGAAEEFDADAFEDPDRLLRSLLAESLRTGIGGAHRANWFGWGSVILWMLTGAQGQVSLPPGPSAREILALRPDCPTELATAIAGLLQPNPEARDPFIAAMRAGLGESPHSPDRRDPPAPPQPRATLPTGPILSGASSALSATATLSRRQTQLLHLLAQGLTNQEIADSLVLSHHTVDSHVQNIYRKLGVNRRIEATVVAVRDGLLD